MIPNELNALSLCCFAEPFGRSQLIAHGNRWHSHIGQWRSGAHRTSERYRVSLGYDGEVIQAERLEGDEIPPYDIEPWMSRKADSFAFAFYPQNTKASENVTFKVTTGVNQPQGTQYFIWTADFSHASLHNVGTATVDANGHLVSDTGAEIKDLTTIVLIPDIPVPGEGADAGVAVTDGGGASTGTPDEGADVVSNTTSVQATKFHPRVRVLQLEKA